VTIPNPDHLFDQAEKLISGRPRQADLRRAVSASYYAVFHAALTEAADKLVGATARKSERYGLVYRSVDHAALRRLCEELQKPVLTDRYRRFEPEGGFAPAIKSFATTILELQRKRHSADYDPLMWFSRTEARAAINSGRAALTRFRATGDAQRQIFGSLLLFSPRAALPRRETE
jgi:uncharacterized protein (UPF0332 family)